jgi:hypothetical protein
VTTCTIQHGQQPPSPKLIFQCMDVSHLCCGSRANSAWQPSPAQVRRAVDMLRFFSPSCIWRKFSTEPIHIWRPSPRSHFRRQRGYESLEHSLQPYAIAMQILVGNLKDTSGRAELSLDYNRGTTSSLASIQSSTEQNPGQELQVAGGDGAGREEGYNNIKRWTASAPVQSKGASA